MVCPRVAITMEDNDLLFYRIKPLFPQCSTLAIQNGRRDNFAKSSAGGFFELLERQRSSGEFDVTTLAIFGPYVESLYRNALGPSSKATYVHTGSIRNNAVPLSIRSDSKRIVYISSMPSFLGSATPDSDDVICFYQGTPVTYSQLWTAENLVVRIAGEFANATNRPFVVLGKRSGQRTDEYKHFSRLLSGLNWSFLAAETQASSYANISSADCLVAVDGTLAYEMLGRGNRVAFVAARLKAAGVIFSRDCDFGFPLPLPQAGPFWTSEPTRAEILRVIDFVVNSTQFEWQQASTILREKLMVYDPLNKQLCQLLSLLRVSHNGPKIWESQYIPMN